MADIEIDGLPTVLLSRIQLQEYNDGTPAWGNRIFEKLKCSQIEAAGKLVIFSADGRELEFREVGHG